jgi:hypothetical protein
MKTYVDEQIASVGGLTGWERVSTTSASDSNDKAGITTDCTGGNKLLGGGCSISVNDGEVSITTTAPADDDTWTCSAAEDGNFGDSWTLTAYAICYTP